MRIVARRESREDWRREQRFAGIGSFLGLAAGLALSRAVSVAAKPSQLPGLDTTLGLDPRGYLVRLLIVALSPLVGGCIALVWARRSPISRPGRPRAAAARVARRASARSSLGTSLFLPAAAAHATTTWIFLAAAAPDLPPLLTLVGLLFISSALAIALGKGDPDRGASALAAASAVLPLALWGTRPVRVNIAAAAECLLLPLLARVTFGRREIGGRLLRAATVWVLLPGSVTALSAAATMKGHIADIFEEGHALLPASEYGRGELPYRDIIPGHGLISDGLLQAVSLRLFGDDYAGIHRGDKLAGIPFWPSFYALGYAAMGSPAAAFGGLLLTFLAWPQYSYLRLLPSLWVIALAILASRTARGWAWFACGALLPVALCVGVEFAVYAGGAALVALWVARRPRVGHPRRFVAGVAASGALVALALAARGILGQFFRSTSLLLPSLLPAYAIPLVRPSLPWPPGMVRWAMALSDRTAFLYAFVAVAIVLLGGLLPRAPRVGGRGRAMLPVLAWIVFAMVSVVERRHIGYPFFLVPVGLLLTLRWFEGARPWNNVRRLGAGAALVATVLLWRPFRLVDDLGFALGHQWLPAGFSALATPARARGAIFPPADAALVRATEEMLRSPGLSAEDTWLDFANAPGLYFLLDRDCPIRYYEVPYYESEAAQNEVIAAVEKNPRVRLVLVSTGLPSEPMDGIPNTVRAPRVARYIAESFGPFLRKGRVEFWVRGPNGEGARGAAAKRSTRLPDPSAEAAGPRLLAAPPR